MTLEAITHDLLAPVQHGFFTRKGGASSGIFAGLNCGLGSSDQTEIVEINRARVADKMGVVRENLVTVYQIHSPDVAVITGPLSETVKADAMVSNTKGVALGILTADCQPVLFADAQAGVVGAAHAGWRGALDGVLGATVDAMVNLGADRGNITAVIGPCISQRAYEVGEEFLDRFLAEDDAYSRFFANGADGKYQFDLPSFGLHHLRSCGIKEAVWCGHCTYSDSDRFYSYRRTTHLAEADYGRLISVIRL